MLGSAGRSARSARALFLPAVAALTLVALWLRLRTLDTADPWWDEGFTYWLATLDVPGMLLRTAGDVHPPLSYLLYHWWLPLAGGSVFALRFMSVLFGVAAVPAMGVLGRWLGGPFAGVLAAGLLAFARFHIWWSQQVRMYALVALLGIISTYLLLRALALWKVEPRRAGRLLACAAVANLAGLYSLYFFGLLVGLESLLVLAWLARLRSARLALAWAGALAGSAVLYAPWLIYFRQHALHYTSSPSPPLPVPLFLEAGWSELALGIDAGVQAYRLPALAMAAAAVALFIAVLRSRGRRRILPAGRVARSLASLRVTGCSLGVTGASLRLRMTRTDRRVLATWLALSVLAVPAVAYGATLEPGAFFNPLFHARYELPALAPLLLLLAWGASRLPGWTRLAPVALFAAVAAVSLPPFYANKHRDDDYQTLARFIRAYQQPGDAIVFDPDTNFQLFLIDYGQAGLPLVSIPEHQPVDAAYAGQLFSGWTRQYQALWLIQEAGGHDAGAQHPVRDWLAGHLQLALQTSVGDRQLALYIAPGAPARSLNAAYQPQHAAALPGSRGFDQPLDAVRPGDVLHLALYADAPGWQLQLAGRTFAGRQLPGQLAFAMPIGSWASAGRQTISAVLSDGRAMPLSSVDVQPAEAAAPSEAKPLAHTVGASFGLVALTSSDMQPAPPGQDLQLELQWQALQPFADNYTVFVHLLDGSGKVVAQRDSQPRSGQSPTVSWQPGQLIDDSYAIPLPPALPPATYTLETGLYLQSTGQRLPLTDGGDHVVLGPVRIPG